MKKSINMSLMMDNYDGCSELLLSHKHIQYMRESKAKVLCSQYDGVSGMETNGKCKYKK